MQARSRLKSRRTRWTPAILLAAVALTILFVASPAVASAQATLQAQRGRLAG